MKPLVLILRPEPGASHTAARAAALGLEPVTSPLFAVRPLPWSPPDPALYDALLLTSGHAAREGGAQLEAFARLPCYAVGEATAAAARAAGFPDVSTGPSDGLALLRLAEAQGRRRLLHLCGRDHIALEASGLTVDRRIVYAADPVEALPDRARSALAQGALVLLHSPRAAGLFARLAGNRSGIRIASISPATEEAAGQGWSSSAVAPEPRDEALLELAAKLCQTEGVMSRDRASDDA